MADELTANPSPPAQTVQAAQTAASTQTDAVTLDPRRPQAKENKPSTLREVLGNATTPAVDADGQSHELPALRIRDVEDLEQIIGGMSNFMWSSTAVVPPHSSVRVRFTESEL